MESGIPEYDIIEPYKRDDGTHAWAKTNKVPLRDKEGNIIGILGTYEDITERKRAEEAFKKKSDEQELLLDNIQTLIWYLTDSETHGIANKACADFIGKKKEDLENKKMYDIMPKEEAEVCIAGNKKVFKKKVPIHTEEWIKNAQGEKRLLSVTKTPKLDTNGNVEYIVCSGMDITKHKLREDKIRKSEDFIKTIFDSMDEIISVVNVHDYSIASINKAFADWTGMNFDEIIGRPCYEILYKKVNPCDDCCCPIREILNTGISSIIEQEQSKNGDKHYFEVSTTPIRNADGKIVQVLCVRKDITERKQAEDALKHKIFQIENLNNIFVGREMKMIELKKEINLLLEELGRPKEYM